MQFNVVTGGSKPMTSTSYKATVGPLELNGVETTSPSYSMKTESVKAAEFVSYEGRTGYENTPPKDALSTIGGSSSGGGGGCILK